MGIYTEYLDRQLSFPDLASERRAQLTRIKEIRGHDVLVFAADVKKSQTPISISYPDLLPITDQLSNLNGSALDLILETHGGSAEIAEQIVRLLRGRFEHLTVIVPGVAKSAGTIMAMAADEILMEPGSALGPIDAQLTWQGKTFSVDALLKGFDRIKQEVVDTGQLNKAYIPILQGLSPGELESAYNAREFATELVTEWLFTYKFKDWSVHETPGKPTTGQPVTDEEKRQRANEIAAALCEHSRWRTHGRSITLADLQALHLKITDYSQRSEADAIRRYFTLLQMTFDTTIYKVFETPVSQIYRFVPSPAQAAPKPPAAEASVIDLPCSKCQAHHRLQANLDKSLPLQPNSLPFPADNKFKCPNCGTEHDLSDLRRQIELQTKKKVVP